jgi:hypothetical protein
LALPAEGVASIKIQATPRCQDDIAARVPILEAQKTNRLLASGQMTGNVVLLAPELL